MWSVFLRRSVCTAAAARPHTIRFHWMGHYILPEPSALVAIGVCPLNSRRSTKPAVWGARLPFSRINHQCYQESKLYVNVIIYIIIIVEDHTASWSIFSVPASFTSGSGSSENSEGFLRCLTPALHEVHNRVSDLRPRGASTSRYKWIRYWQICLRMNQVNQPHF